MARVGGLDYFKCAREWVLVLTENSTRQQGNEQDRESRYLAMLIPVKEEVDRRQMLVIGTCSLVLPRAYWGSLENFSPKKVSIGKGSSHL
jgi:hypothetical protein